QLPAGATELQHLISHRNMNAQIGEIFRACYRYGMASHSDMLRDAKKILFYARAEVERLEGGAQYGVNPPEARMGAGNGVATDSGWILWAGGVCPVAPSTKVQVRFATGNTDVGLADAFYWGVSREDWRVIAYRIMEAI